MLEYPERFADGNIFNWDYLFSQCHDVMTFSLILGK